MAGTASPRLGPWSPLCPRGLTQPFSVCRRVFQVSHSSGNRFPNRPPWRLLLLESLPFCSHAAVNARQTRGQRILFTMAKGRVSVLFCCVLVLLSSSCPERLAAADGDQFWDAQFGVPGADASGGVAAMAVSGQNLYAGGMFSSIGGTNTY